MILLEFWHEQALGFLQGFPRAKSLGSDNVLDLHMLHVIEEDEVVADHKKKVYQASKLSKIYNISIWEVVWAFRERYELGAQEVI